MKIIIAEKPSVAKSIAAIVGAKSRKDGYMEGNGYAVTWAFGHLIGLAMPEEYGFSGFQRENLPIMPKSFILQPRQRREGKEYKSDSGTIKQLNIIKGLFTDCERIIVATDAGREGELIFRYIYNYLKCGKPFDRLWISSLTDRAIKEGMQNLKTGKEYDNLYFSAKARSEADWLVGINASQALSIAAGRGVYSLGRVQTPTLAMICYRYLENRSFKPQTYFQLKLHTAKDTTRFPAISAAKFDNRTLAEEAYNTVAFGKTVEVVRVDKKEANQEPPLLYDLTTLQKEANSKHGFSADKTLSIAQALYEGKLISYPRTGSRYLSTDVFDEIPQLIAGLKSYHRFSAYAGKLEDYPLNILSVDDKKITDHHAIIITENRPSDLSDDERTVYEMVAGRILEAFSGKCKKENTLISLQSSGVSFTARGSIILVPGWQAVFKADEEEKEEDMTILPDISEGDVLSLDGCDILEKQTKPRPIHTESSLLGAMESAGKELENEDEREAMKEAGIGTPAARAAIIETLFSRDYIQREKKSLIPTEKGLTVYEAVKDKKIANVTMTGQWEYALSKIASGEMDAPFFHRGIEVYATQITTELLDMKIEVSNSRTGAICPKCESPIVYYPKVAKCQNAECGLTVFRSIAGKELTDAQFTDLFTKGKTGTIKGLKGKTSGKSFDAAIILDADFKTNFVFSAGKSNGRKKK
jgi:DNA topoisomerase-3